jgi:hypothetical protein
MKTCSIVLMWSGLPVGRYVCVLVGAREQGAASLQAACPRLTPLPPLGVPLCTTGYTRTNQARARLMGFQRVPGLSSTGSRKHSTAWAAGTRLRSLYHLFCVIPSRIVLNPPTHPPPPAHTLITHASTHSSIHPSTHPPTHPSIHPSTHSSTHPPIHPPIHPHTHPSIHPSMLCRLWQTRSSLSCW